MKAAERNFWRECGGMIFKSWMRQLCRRHAVLLAGALSCALCVGADAAQPALELLRDGLSGKSLLENGGFEKLQNGRPVAWHGYEGGFLSRQGEGRGGSVAVTCQNQTASGKAGASQTLELNRTEAAPLVVSGWSRAEGVSGAPDSGYSIYVDIVYNDGTPLWGQTANFRCGTHDWEKRQIVIVPEKPVKRLTLYCLFRGHAGRVWFDDVNVSEVSAGTGSFLWQGMPVLAKETGPLKSGGVAYKTMDGLELIYRGGQVQAVKVDGRELSGGRAGGFMAWDAAAQSDVWAFENGVCSKLNLELDVKVTAQADCLAFDGTIRDKTGKDRAVTLMFALPVEADGWRWGDDIRRERVITGKAEYANTVRVGCGATGAISLYPVGAISGEKHGLAVALDMGRPAIYRLGYHAGLKQLFIAYDFGLVAETKQFPSAAQFRFVIYRFEPDWGFRAAWDKLTKIFPDYFVVRSKEQGIWMPFTDVSTVQGWEDFGFKYHEGNNNVQFDDAHNILSFRYTEPMTWWMPMKPETPRTLEAALKVRDELAADAKASQHRYARAHLGIAMFDEDNRPAVQFQETPWCRGAVWSLNPNPFLQWEPNFGALHWSDAIKEKLYGPSARGQLDGEYLDSLEGYVTANLNYRREHFAATTVPLTFATDTCRPALFKGLAVYEFTRWFCDDVHRMGKLTFANGVPYRFSFLCPWLDVMGTETDWNPGGRYRPSSDAQMCLWRTLSMGKPYLLLMNTRYDDFGPALVEKYFQRSLFFGFYPSMFSHNASEAPYWGNPKWYNRDRPLFKKYIPVVKRIAEAGWQPVTSARCDNPAVLVERFGAPPGPFYFTVYNPTQQSQKGTLLIEKNLTATGRITALRELLSGRVVSGATGGFPLQVEPEQTLVLAVVAP